MAEDVSSSHLRQLYNICISGGEAQLPKAVFVSESGNLYKKKNDEKTTGFSVSIVPADIDEFLKFQKINNLFLKNYIDCDKIVGKLVSRTRHSGDSIKLKNKNGTKLLTKLYNEYRIPVKQRDTLPVIADDQGVIWIYKIGVADRVAADIGSKNILKVNVFEGEE